MKKIVFTLATTALLSSCGIYSSYERPADIKTDDLYGATVTESADSAGPHFPGGDTAGFPGERGDRDPSDAD